MRVAFLYNCSSEDPANAAEDELPAESPVVNAIHDLGHDVVPIACTLDLAEVRQQLERHRPDIVFNRVESLGGSDSMMAAVTLLLDAMQLPYTGSTTAGLVATASKLRVKEWLRAAGLPTPDWLDATRTIEFARKAAVQNSRWIIKSVREHASFELDERSIVRAASYADIQNALRQRLATTGSEHFAEEFIDGREFNISIIGPTPRVLPAAEISFSGFPADKERIVGRHAKWDGNSFEYHNTPRRFRFGASDRQLLSRVTELTLECWRLFDLTGYARVDFRVDSNGNPLILEINTNPCIMPDAGFAAAMAQAGYDYRRTIELILEDALSRAAIPRTEDLVAIERAERIRSECVQ